MTQRDYVSRGKTSRHKKKSAGINKKLLILIALFIIIGFIVGLLLLKQKSPEIKVQTTSIQEPPTKSQLPSRPEEVWSYIQDLETREIPIDNSPASLEKNAQLTAEQRKILAMMEREQQEAEKAKQAKLQETTSVTSSETINSSAPTISQTRSETGSRINQQETNLIQTQQPKSNNVQTTNTTKRSFGLQCGAFKNKQQAENLQARLAMAGFNSRVSTNAEWNRVFIGPIGDRATTIEVQERAKSITNCVLINM